MRDAAVYAEEDRINKEQGESRIRAQELLARAAAVKKPPKELKPELKDAQKQLREAMRSKDKAALDAACNRLEELLGRL